MEPKSMLVFDGPPNGPLVLEVDREIHRPFNGAWNVTIRKRRNDAWTIYCSASGENDYDPNASLPEPVTLNWWTNRQCLPLSPGVYSITTTWTIKGSMGLPDKYTKLVSNVFTVSDPKK